MSRPEATPAAMPRWKKIAIALAAVVLLAGVGLKVHGAMQRKWAPPSTASAPMRGQGLVAGGPTSTSTDQPAAGEKPNVGAGEQVSPYLTYGGFSFFAGLAVGTVLRMFVKMALVATGLVVLGFAGLNYAGIISTQTMKDLGDKANGAFVQLEQKVQGFQSDHMLVGIPSAGLAGAGLVAGFKRK